MRYFQLFELLVIAGILYGLWLLLKEDVKQIKKRISKKGDSKNG